MRNRKKTAFTIVELVIVIAVIGILAAVLIPTFSGVIKNANISNDTQVAAGLTTELRVALPGQEITTEAELMAAIKTIDPDGTMLVPKSLKYGYHYWFVMETQTIILAEVSDIEGRTSEVAAVPSSSEVVAVADGEDVDTTESVMNGYRDIFRNGYYLITSDNALGKIFGTSLDDIDSADTYSAYVKTLTDAKEDRVYGKIAEKLLANLEQTTVRNAHGTFYYKNATSNFEYFAPNVKVLTNKLFVYDKDSRDAVKVDTEAEDYVCSVPSPKGGIVYLPSYVLLVEKGALDYAAKKGVTIMTDCRTVDEIVSIFAPASTNAIIKDASKDGNYIVTKGPAGGSDDADAEITDVLHKYNGENVASVWVRDLVPKLSFEDFEIAYDEVADFVEWNTDALYIYITAETDLYVKNADGTLKSESVIWTGGLDKDGNRILTIDEKTGKITPVSAGETTITATAKNLYDETETQSLTVRVNRATAVNIDINRRVFNLDQGIGPYEIDWFYNAGASLKPAVYGTIDYWYDYACGTGDITVKAKADETVFTVDNLNDIKINKYNNTGHFTVSVDGDFEREFTVNIIDNTQSDIQVNFRDKTNSSTYLYYVGNTGTVTLGALFGTKTSGYDLTGATLNIYDMRDGDGYLYPYNVNYTTNYGVSASFGTVGNLIKDYVKGNDGKWTYTPWTLTADWKNQVIDFEDVCDDTYIKITPANGDAPLVVKVVVVSGTNVELVTKADNTADYATTITNLNSALAAGNAILHTDLNVVTGQTINVGDKNLYGNGYVINAQKYVASAKQSEHTLTIDWCTWCDASKDECHDYSSVRGWGYHTPSGEWISNSYRTTKSYTYEHFLTDVAMIVLKNGTVDNIYINGPVYPKLQYYADDCTDTTHAAHAYTAYYVSGIKVTGAATIKNSYVSGFRQPVKANGTNLTLNNVTLRGGNFANLLLSTGNLSLTDVTTIQDQNGMTDTINTSNNVSVTGMGIVIETGALSAAITIDGYLNQYNWVKQGQGATLPTITTTDGVTLNLNTIFSYLFTGMNVPVIGNVEIGSVKYFIHKDNTSAEADETKASNNYVNAGIVFVEVGTEEYLDTLNVNVNISHKSTRKNGVMAKTSFDTLDMRFRDEGLANVVNAATFLKTDGIFHIWSYKDGRNWTRNGLVIDLASGSTPGVILDATKTETPSGSSNTHTSFGTYTGKYVPLIYRGYYDDFGCYANEYVVNPDNTITANTSN